MRKNTMTEEFDFGSLLEKDEPKEEPKNLTSNKPATKPEKPVRRQISKKPPLHLLTEDNLIHFFKEKEKTKLYEMKIRFYNNSLKEIDHMIKSLFKKGILKRDRNNWYSLKR